MSVRVNGPISSREALAIYLRDQHAIAQGVLSLARRAASNQRGTPAGPVLTQLVDELRDDHHALVSVMRQVGVQPSLVKALGSQLAERMGRLKLNGQLRGSSPLSPVIELEGLLDGITAGRHVWVMLRDDVHIAPDELDPAAMVERLDGHIARVRELWHDAASSAFTSDSS